MYAWTFWILLGILLNTKTCKNLHIHNFLRKKYLTYREEKRGSNSYNETLSFIKKRINSMNQFLAEECPKRWEKKPTRADFLHAWVDVSSTDSHPAIMQQFLVKR